MGIPTVCLVLIREAAERVGIPRSVFLKFPFGRPFGDVKDKQMELAIIRDSLAFLTSASGPGAILDLTYKFRRAEDTPPKP